MYISYNPTTLHALQIYHPNIDLEGNVCLNILREDWKPVLNLQSVILGLVFLFLVRSHVKSLSDARSLFAVV